MERAGDRESRLRAIAHDVSQRAVGQRPAIFEPRDWLRRTIERSLDDEALRTALFRFVDVLPSLHGARDVGSHLEEYFASVDHALGGLTLLTQTLHAGWLMAPMVRKNVTALARRFIAEEDPAALRSVLEGLREEPAAFTLDLVGEATVSEQEAVGMLARYRWLLAEVGAAAASWPETARIDRDDRGPIPRVNASIKLSSLYARFDPLDPECERVARERLRLLALEAARSGAALTVDMEQHAFKEVTLSIFRSLLEDDAFRDRPPLAIALQAYLPETAADLENLLAAARARGRRIGVRLIKGAYWDSEVAWARQKGWPPPVFVEKAATDLAYERLSARLLESRDVVDAAFGSHNLRSIAHAIACARESGLAPGAYEIQMLYGMAEPLRRALVESGERVRVYVPVGALIPGMAYLIRRLLENTSNVSFLRESYAEGRDLDRLLAPPRPVGDEGEARGCRPDGGGTPGFDNEPPRDFSRAADREPLRRALADAHAALPAAPRLVGRARARAETLESRNPADPAEVVGRVEIADAARIEGAVAAAAEAAPSWRRRPVAERVAVLRDAAREMRARREELAAKIILEVGKGWRDADAEVCEAIDYLEYYGREMARIDARAARADLPGETNALRYAPVGVVAVISPWNFPLAIATGMTCAALVAGNTVVLKPAEQSPVIGAELHAILSRAGLPRGTAGLVQGGAEVGRALVEHRDVGMIAFTGSRSVGLEILRATAGASTAEGTLKRAVCEMGGKNAIVVDEDADHDEALGAILESAFGYQGQKCSAASRLIVVGGAGEILVRRLIEAARTLRVGPPDDPRNAVGPLIEAEARARVLTAVERAARDGHLLLPAEPRPAGESGFFVSPAIASGLEPTHPLAQEEIFGPLLCVFSAATFERAIEIANATRYGLTGGVFSRSPAHLEHARREFRVGNLYLNRGTTGAVVGRQPFGGVKLSGAGWKAGGPDYVRQFLESRTVSENTQRHGFAPSA